jgi:cell division protein FtsQ
MSDILSVSRSDLANRRKQLRRQRRWRFLVSFWQTTAIISLAGGLVWLTTQPNWVLQDATQVTIDGNELLSPGTVRSLLPIQYPQSLLHLDPDAIATHLEAQGPIAVATVNRQLLPPGLTVQIQERHPVAIWVQAATQTSLNAPGLSAAQQSDRSNTADIGLIDERGFWMSLSGYVELDDSLSLPSLKVLGMREQQRSQWSMLYQSLQRAPIRTYEIDWRDPSNLILETELGRVHFGPYSDRFEEQLKVLDQLRELPQQIDMTNVDYIDLRNPDSPLIQQTSAVIAPQWVPSPDSTGTE